MADENSRDILIELRSDMKHVRQSVEDFRRSDAKQWENIDILNARVEGHDKSIGFFTLGSKIILGALATGVVGVLVGYGVTSFAANILDNLGWGFLSPYYSPFLFIGLILFATLTGAISGVIPAIRASKINTVDALRYE